MVEELKCNLHKTLKKSFTSKKELEIKAKQSFFSYSSHHNIHTAYLCLPFGYLCPSARSPLPASFR